MSNQKPVPGTGGDHYVPYGERTGEASAVYFTRDLSAEGLQKIFRRVGGTLTGKVGIKLHTASRSQHHSQALGGSPDQGGTAGGCDRGDQFLL